MADAFHVDLDLRRLDVGRAAAVAAAIADAVLVLLVLLALDRLGQVLDRQSLAVEGRGHAVAVAGGADQRGADLEAGERRAGLRHHGADQGAELAGGVIGLDMEVLQIG